jgi:hypothetical protein
MLDHRLVRLLAYANIAGGMLGWTALIAARTLIEHEGRWLLAATSDAFIAVGVLELVALARTADPP